MKTPLFIAPCLPACAILLGLAEVAHGDELRIRIPNPIPRIVKHVERVGKTIVRKAERIEVEIETAAEYKEPPPRVPPPSYPNLPPISSTGLPPSQSYVVTPEPAAQASTVPVYRRDPLVYDSARSVAPPRPHLPPGTTPIPITPLPPAQRDPTDNRGRTIYLRDESDADPTVSTIAPPGNEPTYQPLPPSAANSPSITATRAPGAPSTTVASVEKPTPPALPPFGKSVPGRPGLVYPPGLKEAPENMVDVRGIMPGTKVRDPATKTVFRVP